jgi:hypothetical protein
MKHLRAYLDLAAGGTSVLQTGGSRGAATDRTP